MWKMKHVVTSEMLAQAS